MGKKFLKKIIAQSAEDLQIISACCSEASVKISEIKYLPSSKLFLLSLLRKDKEKYTTVFLPDLQEFNAIYFIFRNVLHNLFAGFLMPNINITRYLVLIKYLKKIARYLDFQ